MGPFGGEHGVKGYIATIVVDSSDETITLVLDKKEDLFLEWIPVAKRIERAYGYKLKVFQCDGGGEFINNKLLTCLQNLIIFVASTKAQQPFFRTMD